MGGQAHARRGGYGQQRATRTKKKELPRQDNGHSGLCTEDCAGEDVGWHGSGRGKGGGGVSLPGDWAREHGGAAGVWKASCTARLWGSPPPPSQTPEGCGWPSGGDAVNGPLELGPQKDLKLLVCLCYGCASTASRFLCSVTPIFFLVPRIQSVTCCTDGVPSAAQGACRGVAPPRAWRWRWMTTAAAAGMPHCNRVHQDLVH